jgi:hypothetical protein
MSSAVTSASGELIFLVGNNFEVATGWTLAQSFVFEKRIVIRDVRNGDSRSGV